MPSGDAPAVATLLTLATVSLLGGAASAAPPRAGGTFRIAVAGVGLTGLPRFATIDPALSAYLAEPIVLRVGCANSIQAPVETLVLHDLQADEGSNSIDPDDRQASRTNSNRRRTTRYVSDHSTRDLQSTGVADATEHRHDAGDRVFEPHGLG